MHISDFDYALPPELIAREPARPRDASRMMVLDRNSGRLIDSEFRRLPEFLQSSDVLVLNDTRVIHARAIGRLERASGSTRSVEILFAGPIDEACWEVLCRPGRRIHKGDRIVLADGKLEGVFGERREHGLRLLQLSSPVESFLESYGHIPLPPYIERPRTLSDEADYQTIFADAPGAIAAPTAGLHFTELTFGALRQIGLEIVKITLHVGIGTFIPVRANDPSQHVLKPERFSITQKAASSLNAAREQGRRIVTVGTTTTRALEYVVGRHGCFVKGMGEADLYILPGFEFKVVNAMLTNFHLPKSTLIMLVSAFASRERILAAYRHAVQQRYRFYSYGDCMFITSSLRPI
jgi:S-adenosylmethionine:tRNA ribosyltransferase-isomerase